MPPTRTNARPVLDYRNKSADASWLRRHLISHPPIHDLFFTLRALFVTACSYFLFVSNEYRSIVLFGRTWNMQWRPQGLLLITLDPAYRGRPLSPTAPNDFVGSILASSTSAQWPWADWIFISPYLVVPAYFALMILFWRYTRPRKEKTIA
jgi:hypothetical protein